MNQAKTILTENILPFWIDRMQDQEQGGFYGRIDGSGYLHKQAPKGAILNMRILWTFSSAYRILKTPIYLEMAERAFRYIINQFIDKEYGGIYWELYFTGRPLQTKKQLYVQGFALYGFSEYYRATGDRQALELSKDIFRLIESCHDEKKGGYPEAFTREWKPIEDMRLSEKDANEKKTMNTHLHLLEPYTNLFRIWPDSRVGEALKKLIFIFTDRIFDPQTHNLRLFFDEDWNVKSDIISYGHDIEAAWLLWEAACIYGDEQILEQISSTCLKIVNAALDGFQPDGSLVYEKENDHTDRDRHWWVQAEAVVGLMYMFKLTNEESYHSKANQTWDYIMKNMIDTQNGEWYWSRLADGSINRTDDKAGFWKCPYHNGRMCMELMENFNNLT